MTSTSNLNLNSPQSGEDEVLVKVEGVSKKFCRDLKKSLWYGICDISSELNPLGRKSHVPGLGVPGASLNQEPGTKNQELAEGLRPDEFYAVRDVSFELRRGECLGLIGRNGAGKTTLLKILNGLIKPDTGSITMRGRIGALIALGAGFNPILTGRENIYVNGSVLGLSKKEIDRKLEEIIDFSEISEFIDSPVRSYSSGMVVRLGFAVAANLSPDVLMLDEVLAVGDLAFRMKCYNKVDELREKAAVILVSHNMEHIGRICSATMLLKHGQVLHCGDTLNGMLLYESQDNDKKETKASKFDSLETNISDFKISSDSINLNDQLSAILHINNLSKQSVNIRFTIINRNNGQVASTAESKLNNNSRYELKRGENKIKAVMKNIKLRPGDYEVAVSVFDMSTGKLLSARKGFEVFTVEGSFFGETHYLDSLYLKQL